MVPHSSTLAWKIPWTEEPGRLQSMGSLESDTTERLHFHFSLSCIGEGNGNPLQYSGLENPMDSVAYGVAKLQTQLSDLRFAFTADPRCCTAEINTTLSGNYPPIENKIIKKKQPTSVSRRQEGAYGAGLPSPPPLLPPREIGRAHV